MTAFFDKDHLVGTADYMKNFWNYMRGKSYAADRIQAGADVNTGGFALPFVSSEKLKKQVNRESLFRNIATVVTAQNCGNYILAKDCDDLAQWVPENGSVPIYDGINDFTRYTVEINKLVIFVKLDNAFVHDASFDFEDYLIKRLAKNFAKAEDYGFITGTGDHMPTGILNENGGVQVGFTANAVTFDSIIGLYFSLDAEYRKNAVWLMNDETALTLRLLKDENGNYLWNHANDTIFGKSVVISDDMPSADIGKIPVVFGDFSYYWIVDRSPVNIQTLKERFVAYDQTGYFAMKHLDGKLIRRDALKGLKITG